MGEFIAPKTLILDRFGERFARKSFLGSDETPPALEQSFKAATKLKRQLLTDLEMETVLFMELSSLAEDIHFKTREASQNPDLHMQEFLRINKAVHLYRVSW